MCAKILAWLVCTGYHTEATTTRKDVFDKIMEAKINTEVQTKFTIELTEEEAKVIKNENG